MHASAHAIEPLEIRIAPAAVLYVTDVDGDKITITSSKGTILDLRAAVTPFAVPVGDPEIGGYEIENIHLGLRSIFEGTDLTITATPQMLDPDGDGKATLFGDGLVNIGTIQADGQDGGVALNLGKVTIDGDLASIRVGTGAQIPAIKSLSIASMGESQVGSYDVSRIIGSVTAISVKGNIDGSFIDIQDGNLGSLKIGGSLIGSGGAQTGSIQVEGNVGLIDIKGDVRGGRDTTSSNSLFSGRIQAGGNITSISIGGSLVGGSQEDSGFIKAGGSIGNATIKGRLAGGEDVNSGAIRAGTKIGNVTIGGSLIGGTAERAGSIFVEALGGTIGAIKIGGDLQGASFNSDTIYADGDIASLTVGGSVSTPIEGQNAVISKTGKIGTVTIKRDLLRGEILAEASMGAVTIGGSVIAGKITVGAELGKLGPVKIAGDLIGGTTFNSGQVMGGNVSSVSIGGSVIGGSNTISGLIYAEDSMGTVTIGGDVLGGTGSWTGVI